MKFDKIERDYLLGLYLFCRQVQLSLDRAEWQEFVIYLEGEYKLEEILNSTKSNFPSIAQGSQIKVDNGDVGALLKLFARKNSLYEIEQIWIYQSIQSLFGSINADISKSPSEVATLRSEFVDICLLLERRVSDFDESKCHVRYFNQAQNYKTDSIENLLGYSWPAK